jgi:ABC-2 type transport system permease protein
MTRERERGTMENLLAMPVQPLEVMSGKIIPYIFIGLIQATIILLAAVFIFHVPFFGSIAVLYGVALLFIAANLTWASRCRRWRRTSCRRCSSRSSISFRILLSGFMFPFRGMPEWAQAIGSLVPATYFMRLVRGVLLKGNGWVELWPNIWPMMIFTVVLMAVAVKFYRRTLD